MTFPTNQFGPSADVAEALSGVQILAEATVGYYRKLTDGGIPADVAAVMVTEFHMYLMGMLPSGNTKGHGRR
jgi:hypothetical protein